MRTSGQLAGHRRTAAAALAVGVAGAACVGFAATPGWTATGVLVVTPSPVYAATTPDLVAARVLAGRTPRLPAGASLDVTASGPVLRVAVTARDPRTAVRIANAVAADAVPAALRAQAGDGVRAGRAATGTPSAPVTAADVTAALEGHGLAATTVRRATAAVPVAGRTVRAVAVVRLDGPAAAAPAPADAARLLAAALSGRDALRAVVGERDATLAVRADGAAVELVAAAGSSQTAEEVARDAMSDARGPLTRVLRANGLPDDALALRSLTAPVPAADPAHVPGWLLGLLAAAGAATAAGAVLDSRERRRERDRAGRRERRAAAQEAVPAPVEPAWGWSPVRLSEWQGEQPPVVDVDRSLPASLPPEPLRAAVPDVAPDLLPDDGPDEVPAAAEVVPAAATEPREAPAPARLPEPLPEPVVALPDPVVALAEPAGPVPGPVVSLPDPTADPAADPRPPATGPVRVVDLRSRIFGGDDGAGERLALGPDGRADLWSEPPGPARADVVPGLLRVVPPAPDRGPLVVPDGDDTPTGLTRPVGPAAVPPAAVPPATVPPAALPPAVAPTLTPASGPRSADPTALPTLPPVLVAPPAPFAPAQRSAPFGRPVPPAAPPFRPVQRPGASSDAVRPLDVVRPLDTARPFDRPGASTPWNPTEGPSTAAWAPVAPQPAPVVPAPPATAMPGVTVLPGGTSAGGAGSTTPGPAAARPDAAGPGADPAWSDILGAGGPPARPQRPSRFRPRR